MPLTVRAASKPSWNHSAPGTPHSLIVKPWAVTSRPYRGGADNDLVVESALEKGLPGEHIWIGLNDFDVEGKLGWIDGSDFTYSNWRPGEPSGDSDCGTIYHYASLRGMWNDLGCLGNGYEGGYACQVE